MPKKAKMQINKSQSDAINHKNGPILVVAGAGTGKTRVITERIKNLIEKRKVKSNQILALTFTEKAAKEMVDRVQDVMPLGYEEPWISTFHSFADRILKQKGIEIGLDVSYKVLSGPDQWLLLRKNIFKMNLKYFRPLGNPTKFIFAILKFISRLQDENISPEDLKKYVDNLVTQEEEEKLRWIELSQIYETYQKIKLENSKLDFGDLITWLIKLLDDRPNILNELKKQFKHILVDEFQDTNYAQYQLIKKLYPHEKHDADSSLLVVGDDSQSIYKFRGAAVSNILEFMKDYENAKMVTLTQNYRSTQKILDGAYNLIQNNNPDSLESKLNISKKLTSVIENAGDDPAIFEMENFDDEVEFVISKIYEVLAKEPSLTYKDIAILARANNHLDPFVLAFKKYGLPYQLVGNRGLYDQDEVRDMLALLKVIVNPKDSISLFRVLNIDSFEIPQNIITYLLTQSKYKKQDIWEIIPDAHNDNLQNLYKLIIKYQDLITKKLPVDFVYNLVNESRYINTYLLEETIENNLSIKNLDLFLNIIKKFEIDYRTDYKNIPTLIDLVDHLEFLIEAGDNPAQAELEDIDTINLLTVHASKGLEYQVVFMINLITGRFPSRNQSDIIKIPDDLIKETLPTGDEHIQEERRLFYVGMTRAKKYLYLCYAQNYGGSTQRKPCGYLNETGFSVKKVDKQSDIKKLNTQQTSLFGIESGYKKFLLKQTDFTPSYLSYSQIDTYKICPLKYKYSYVLNVPTPPNHALSFGITIHDTLRDFHSKLLFKDVSLPELLEMYEKNWQPLGYIDEDHRKIQFEQGKNLLEKYYLQNKKDKSTPLALEKSFNIKIDGIKFYGRIDRIDEFDGGIEIIDYKTGATKTQEDVDKDDQVAFYAIAAKDALELNPKKLTYYFIESGTKISTTRTEEQLQKKKGDVTQVIGEIKKGKFDAKSGLHCGWCDYSNICPFAYKG